MFQIFWAEDDIECHVGYGGGDHIFTDGYQVLFAQPAYEYRLTEVRKIISKK